MTFLTEEMKNDLKWAMRQTLLESCSDKKICGKGQIQFIKEDATYEQLLNLCFTDSSSGKYFVTEALEHYALGNMLTLIKEDGVLCEQVLLEGGWVKNTENWKKLIRSNETKLKNLKDLVRKQAQDVKGQVSSTMGKYGIGSGFKKSADKNYKIVMKNRQAVKILSDKIKTYKNKYNDAVKYARDDMKPGIMGTLSTYMTGVKDYFTKDPMGKKVAIGGLIALGSIALGVATNWIYKRYFSAAAKACKGKSGEEFKSCINKFKAQAIKKTIATINKNKSKCKDEKCSVKFAKQAAKWQNKLSKLK